MWKDESVLIKLENDYLLVEVNKFGAELSSVRDRRSSYEFIWQSDEAYWNRHAPILFPIVGRLREDRFEYKGESYEMTQHGFARDSEFEVVEERPNAVTFSLKSSEETLKKYPFEFELLVRYVLFENELSIRYEVVNGSAYEEMYYSIGGHPGFNVSQTDEGEFDKVYFQMEPERDYPMIPLTADGFIELGERSNKKAEILKLEHELFKNDALIYKIDRQSEMVLRDKANDVEVRLKPEQMQYVGLWSPYPKQAGFVCMEPWAGIADRSDSTGKYDEKFGIHRLDKNEAMVHGYSIAFSKE